MVVLDGQPKGHAEEIGNRATFPGAVEIDGLDRQYGDGAGTRDGFTVRVGQRHIREAWRKRRQTGEQLVTDAGVADSCTSNRQRRRSEAGAHYRDEQSTAGPSGAGLDTGDAERSRRWGRWSARV